MSERAQFGYCQARLQARYATLPVAADWQRLAGARTFAAFVAEARDGRLRAWVSALAPGSKEHEVERGLRALIADTVQEVSTWVPKPWRPAVAWVGWLPYLPVLEHLAAAESRAPQWALTDPRWEPLLDAAGTPDRTGLERARLLPLLTPAQPTHLGSQVASRWGEAWQTLWPACNHRCRRDLNHLTRCVTDHLRAFRQADPTDAWDLRERLRERLRLDFHRRPIAPVAPFLYLGLNLLDLERLRGELLSRLLFPARPVPVHTRTGAA